MQLMRRTAKGRTPLHAAGPEPSGGAGTPPRWNFASPAVPSLCSFDKLLGHSGAMALALLHPTAHDPSLLGRSLAAPPRIQMHTRTDLGHPLARPTEPRIQHLRLPSPVLPRRCYPDPIGQRIVSAWGSSQDPLCRHRERGSRQMFPPSQAARSPKTCAFGPDLPMPAPRPARSKHQRPGRPKVVNLGFLGT